MRGQTQTPPHTFAIFGDGEGDSYDYGATIADIRDKEAVLVQHSLR